MKFYAGLGLFLLLAASSLKAQPTITLTPVVTGVNSPVYATHCGDDRLFVIERTGIIHVQQPGSAPGVYSTFLNISAIVIDGGEKGLLGLAFHPDYKNNGYFYVNYTNNGGGASGKSVLARYSVDPADSNVALPASGVILDTIHQPFSNHNGGCLQFGPDGYLYMGMGDGGSGNDPGNRALNKALKLGKMLRYDVSNPNPPYYFVPSTNPFVDSVGVRPEIWSYGLRNPWRFSFDRITGDMWLGDVGQGTREEIDFEPAGSPGGLNYGWRCYEGSIPTPGVSTTGCPPFANTAPPIFDYIHSGSTGDCSLTGGYLYRGAQIGGLYGRYLFADYCSGRIRMLEQDSTGTWNATLLLNEDDFEISSFGEDRLGEVYVCFLSAGIVYKITSPDCLPSAAIVSDSLTVVCPGGTAQLDALEGTGFSYQWFQNGLPLSGDTSAQVLITDTGSYTVVVTNDGGCTNESEPVAAVGPFAPVDVDILPVSNVCYSSPGITLQANPSGGTFSGTSINANGLFSTSTATYGQQTAYYTYVDSLSCNTIVMDTATFNFIAPTPLQLIVPFMDSDSIVVCVNDGANFAAIPSGGVFTSTNGTFTGNTLNSTGGVTTVHYTYMDTNGCNNITSVTFLADICAGVESLHNISFSVYPNPTHGELLINLIPSTKPFSLDVFNNIGQRMIHEEIAAGIASKNISLKQFADGMYFIRLHNDDGTAYAKVIKTSIK